MCANTRTHAHSRTLTHAHTHSHTLTHTHITHTHLSFVLPSPRPNTSSNIFAVTLDRTDETQGKPRSFKQTHFFRLSSLHPFIPPSVGFTPEKREVSGAALKNDRHPLIFSAAETSLLQIKARHPPLLRLLHSKTKQWGFFSALCSLSFPPLVFFFYAPILSHCVSCSESFLLIIWYYGPPARCHYSFTPK